MISNLDISSSLNMPFVKPVVITILLWELIWKGFALYRAGKKQQPWWFFFLLIINSMGILPIIYLLISKDKKKRKK